MLTTTLILVITTNSLYSQCFTCDNAPPGAFFCDDFESTSPLTDRYFEVDSDDGDLLVMNNIGRDGGRALRILFQQGEVGAGGLKKSFGKIPGNYIAINATRKDTTFDEIYWRMDVRHQPGWLGNGPAKLSRAIVFATYDWAQGMSAHLWSGGQNDKFLLQDPATGIDVNGTLKATHYNDFPNWRWLGYKIGTTPMFADENAGTWYCVVGHVKLNTPGASDGVFEFWINDTLQQSVSNLNWHGNYNADTNNYKINAVFFENYWNAGSPQEQERYFDNLVISTKPIPCRCDETTSVRGEGRWERGEESSEKRVASSELVVSVRYFDLMGREIVEIAGPTQQVVLQVTAFVSGRIKTKVMALR